MTSASPLTPHAALGWLRSLSIDITAAAVLDANGAVMAGDAALAGEGAIADEGAIAGDPAATGVAPAPGATGAPPGPISARSERHAIVVRVGPRALQRLVRADLQAALEALESR